MSVVSTWTLMEMSKTVLALNIVKIVVKNKDVHSFMFVVLLQLGDQT